ncbi:hypothetical protein NDU88_005021 [Pleurodeles waltl]|uniref:Uncharacterized protein n=1 Tax=Pleurodeles waltl TaxID=8319 RepID=A0AAV7V2T8_PLEWA|nr:hypothetical protein NDU88_005021 [Pleurodeles waltl]
MELAVKPLLRGRSHASQTQDAHKKLPHRSKQYSSTHPHEQDISRCGISDHNTLFSFHLIVGKRNCGGEKPASWIREAPNREAKENGADEEQSRPRTKQEDEEEAGGGTNLTETREAKGGTPATLLEKRSTLRCISTPR